MNLKKGMFKNLKKEMPELNKQCLNWFIKWFEKRENLKKILKTRELKVEELDEFKRICNDFSKFGESNVEHFNKHKIEWKIMLKYLTTDISYCDKELTIKKSIDLSFERDLKNIKEEVTK